MKYRIFIAAMFVAVLVAVASGGSTLAALGDSEAQEGNFFYAGGVDFRVGWNLSRNNLSSQDQIPIDNPYSIFDERNITPGDHGEATIGLYNQDNPAYIQFWANQTGNSENERIPSEHTERFCSNIRNYEEGDSFDIVRNGGNQVTYSIESKKESYIELDAPENKTLGENGINGTDRFEIELNGKPRSPVIEIESGGETAYITLKEGESAEVFSGALEVKVLDFEKIDTNQYRVIIEVTSDSNDQTSGLTGLNADFCGNLSYYQIDFVQGEVIQELGEQGIYGPRKVFSFHGNTIEGSSGKGGSDQCVESKRFATNLEERTVTINFTVKSGCNQTYTFASYEKPSGGEWKPDEADQQVLIDFDTSKYTDGDYSRTINLPQRPVNNNQGENVTDETEEKGELGDALRFTLWYDDGDNKLESDESVFFNGTAHELDQSDIGNGFLLDANLSEFGEQQVTDKPLFIGFKWLLPENTQCNVQTDSKKFDFKFSAKQERHNLLKLIETPMFLGDQEYSADNYFEAGEFAECEKNGGVCGPIKDLEDGTKYSVTRTTDQGIEEVKYHVTRDSNNSVKFEDPVNENQLGEDGEMESEVFTVSVYGETNETVYVKTKAGQFEGSAMLQGEGDTVIDTSNLWTLELVEINDKGDHTEFKIKVTSDSEEGRESPALSNILFQFCEPIQKEGYYQLDFNEGDTHEPEAGVVHPDLFMAALSDRDDGKTNLNPSLLDQSRKPSEVKMLKDRFIINGNTATAKFNVTGGPITLSLASFEMPGPFSGWRDSEVNLQVLYDNRTKVFESGNHKMTVELPTKKYPGPGSKYRNQEMDNIAYDRNDSNTDNETSSEKVEKKMLSHWKLDGTMREVNDSAGSQHGDNNGAKRGVKGKNGSAFEFDGSDAVKIEHTSEYELENGTVMMWFEMDDNQTNWLLSKDRDSCRLDCGHLSIAYGSGFINSKGLGARIQNQGGGTNDVILRTNESKKEIKSGEWHHVALSFGQKGAKMYVNGELHDSSTDTDGISGNALETVIGHRYDEESGKGLSGKIDDIRIYNHQLSSQNITDIVESSVNDTEIQKQKSVNRSVSKNKTGS